MNVLFIKDCSSGKKGQIKEVNDGFANNFLLPKGFVVLATPQIVAKINKEENEAKQKKARETEKLQSLKKIAENKLFTVKVKIGDKGQIFGGVHEADIINTVNSSLQTNFTKNQIGLSGIIKQTGEYDVLLKINSEISAKLKIQVLGI